MTTRRLTLPAAALGAGLSGAAVAQETWTDDHHLAVLARADRDRPALRRTRQPSWPATTDQIEFYEGGRWSRPGRSSAPCSRAPSRPAPTGPATGPAATPHSRRWRRRPRCSTRSTTSTGSSNGAATSSTMRSTASSAWSTCPMASPTTRSGFRTNEPIRYARGPAGKAPAPLRPGAGPHPGEARRQPGLDGRRRDLSGAGARRHRRRASSRPPTSTGRRASSRSPTTGRRRAGTSPLRSSA